ncbi:BID domain-containing T4SS effector [Bartonella sp. AR 15-3]|uniref:BID domain-containing T4SS effector n=1 Tax=Bartonella sp. AR 15-3 TaxID=545617 RepID=UPI0001F4CACE|nr:BID domain-containing T4SS effector [Bartonella sp. AR 15-3]OPB31282.1 Bartonella effector protein Bep9 [Bartonella sp. AR 15-3]CBI79686.1 Bartonella effector protein (Bep); substrate of VirB T4SS [Bartonella sp. AR 15-3]
MTLANKTEGFGHFLIPPKQLSISVPDTSQDKNIDGYFSAKKRAVVKTLSAIVFRDGRALDRAIDRVTEHPGSVYALAKMITEKPETFGKLAGSIKLGLRTPSRIRAEKNIQILADEIVEYAQMINALSNNYFEPMQRSTQAVEMLSDDVLHLLNLPNDIRRHTLEQQDTSKVQKELSYFLDEMAFRLSENENGMLRSNNYKMLAKSLDISKHKAQEIINIVRQVESLQLEIQEINKNRFSQEKHAEVIENDQNIYESYDPQTQSSESLLNPSKEINPTKVIDSIYDNPSKEVDPVYANYTPNKTQTQNSRSFLNSAKKVDPVYDDPSKEINPTKVIDSIYDNPSKEVDPVYANYTPNKTQTQNSRSFLNSAKKIDPVYDDPSKEINPTKVIDSIYDNPSKEVDPVYANYTPNKTQTQNSRSFLNSAKKVDPVYDDPSKEINPTKVIDSIYDNPSKEVDPVYANYTPNKTQTQNSRSFLNSAKKIDPVYDDPSKEIDSVYANYIPNKTQTQNSRSFLIPPQELGPLTQNEIINKIFDNIIVQRHIGEIKHLSGIVFGNKEVFNSVLTNIIETKKPEEIGEGYIKVLEVAPKNFAKLAGIKMWGLKNPRYKQAKENVPELCKAIKDYTNVVKKYKEQILSHHKEEQKRVKQAVLMPNNEIQRFLNMPSDMLENILIKQNISQLHKEFSNFLNQVHSRLTAQERKAIKRNDYHTLARNIKVPEVKAREIINVVKKAQECQQKIKDIISQKQKQMIAVAH